MTWNTVRKQMELCTEIDMVGCNSQPDFEALTNVLQGNADMIRDIQFPVYDTMFIRFNKTVNPIRMAELVRSMWADEVNQAKFSHLQYLDSGVVSSKCARDIDKYIRFWWD